MQQYIIVHPSFLMAVYEMEEKIKEGWNVSQQNAPAHNFTLFEIFMEKDDVPQASELKKDMRKKENK